MTSSIHARRLKLDDRELVDAADWRPLHRLERVDAQSSITDMPLTNAKLAAVRSAARVRVESGREPQPRSEAASLKLTTFRT